MWHADFFGDTMLEKRVFDSRLLHIPPAYLAARIETQRAYLSLCETGLRTAPPWRRDYWQGEIHSATSDLAEMEAALEMLQNGNDNSHDIPSP